MVTKEEGRKKLPEVIELFRKWKVERNGLTNEEDVKTLIEELFKKVLGWDISDIYRERHPGPNNTKVDFKFKIATEEKLFLEAKALDVPWTQGVFRQVYGYGWGAKNLEYVALSNFQSIKVFNSKWKDKDKQIFEIENIEDCLKFPDVFDRLWHLSKESFLNGEIDREAKDRGKKLNKTPISDVVEHLLGTVKSIRERLANDIKSYNKDLQEEEREDVIQKLINRFIFIRVSEDRNLEAKENSTLWFYLCEWERNREEGKEKKSLLEYLHKIFDEYDKVYDSSIFTKDEKCESVKIHDNVLKEVIEELHTAEDVNSVYNFAHIGVDVIGSVYEEYLGYLMKGKKVTESHAHKKKQGIYYTLPYIVDYIVRNTLGETLEQSKEIDKIKVLDPACGSGSFLIRAYDYFVKSEGKTELSFDEKRKILLNNIYGVDLDPKAVEIAKLSLFLKMEERGELPDLKNNIKNGNSLIDDDTISGKAFKWEKEFEDIMKKGRFDVIIGNPPYGSKKMLSEEEKKFIKNKHKFIGSNDTAEMFIEKSFNLLKRNGYFGFIIPKPLTYITSWNQIRKFLLTKDIKSIIDVSKAFKDVFLEQVIICIKNSPNTNSDILVGDVVNDQIKMIGKVKREHISERIFQIYNFGKDEDLYNKITSDSDNLIEHFKIWAGIGGITPKLKRNKIGPIILKGKTISRYGFTKDVWYVPESIPNEKDAEEHNEKRVVCQDIIAHITTPFPHIKITATMADRGVLTNETVINFSKKDDKIELETLLCILNSKLMSWFVYKFIFNNAIRTMHFRPGYADYAPIKIPSNQEPFVTLCQKMIQLQNKSNELEGSKSSEKYKIEEEIKKTDKEIDELVYKTYGITDKEKRIIEENINDKDA
jgi:type I restriction-modification system DNA methylase subunit